MYDTYSVLISSMPVSSLDVVPAPENRRPPPAEDLSGELGLLVETEARGTGLVSPMLRRLPPPEDTVMVTGEEEGDDAVLTMLLKMDTE